MYGTKNGQVRPKHKQMRETKSKRNFRVLVNGQNFLVDRDGKPRMTGFYTARFVEAQDPEQAEAVAVELIQSNSNLSDIILNQRGDTPVLNVEEIEEIKKLQPQLGYAFYSEE